MIIIIIIISIIITIISFMQVIYPYIPETNCVPKEYSVAAILFLLFIVLIPLVSVLNLLCFYISTFRSMCAVSNMAVFCSFLTTCFPVMLLTYVLNDFKIVLVAPVITGTTFVFTFRMRCMSIVRSLYFRIFSVSFLIIFLLLLLLLLLLITGSDFWASICLETFICPLRTSVVFWEFDYHIIIIIIIIFIYCNWVVTRWQWLFHMYTKYEIVY